MTFRISKQQLNTSNKQYATNGNLVGNPVLIKKEISCFKKQMSVLSSSMKLGPGAIFTKCKISSIGLFINCAKRHSRKTRLRGFSVNGYHRLQGLKEKSLQSNGLRFQGSFDHVLNTFSLFYNTLK